MPATTVGEQEDSPAHRAPRTR